MFIYRYTYDTIVSLSFILSFTFSMRVIVELCIYAIHVDWLQIQCSLLWHGCRTNLLQWTRDKRPFLSKTCNTSTCWQYIHKLRMFLFYCSFAYLMVLGCFYLCSHLPLFTLSIFFILYNFQSVDAQTHSYIRHICMFSDISISLLCTERNFNCSFSNAKCSVNECKYKADGDASKLRYVNISNMILLHKHAYIKMTRIFSNLNSWVNNSKCL